MKEGTKKVRRQGKVGQRGNRERKREIRWTEVVWRGKRVKEVAKIRLDSKERGNGRQEEGEQREKGGGKESGRKLYTVQREMMVKEKVRRRLDRKEKVYRSKAGRGWQKRKQRKEEGKKVGGSHMERKEGRKRGQEEVE
jgi:hypothetical protein